ncbi:PQQ-binding-like beta-propeller repeat protein [Bryobacter aggregatus]|uniref:outer membrane protein assembly factor BamB family protein n=1 Tax=Bryobacter aggregatus TaxID=360054 RepID=UPI00068AB67A|nr:PQQ-binding-like beta-propeller repeat protein [Bryobacter aggregatus]
MLSRILGLALLGIVASSSQELPDSYRKMCAACHGDNARGTDRGPNLIDTRSLRSRSEAQIRDIIRNGTRGGMPAFPLPAADLDTLSKVIRSWNASAFDANPAGDLEAGQKIFAGQCLSCHMVRGVGASNGPDLSNLGNEMTVREIEETLSNPSSRKGKRNGASCPSWAFCADDPWGVVTVQLKSGKSLRGFARSQGAHDLQLQDFNGKITLLTEKDYTRVDKEKGSYMPAYRGHDSEKRNLVAYLSRLNGIPEGPLPQESAPVSRADRDRVQKPAAGEWPGYHGLPSGNRHSELAQITTLNAAKLKPAWSYSLPHMSLQTTPLVVDGIMYVTGPNQVCALDSSTGREIWCYVRPRGDATKISGDAAKGAQRGAAILGDRVFFSTDDAHLIALNRHTGALMWQNYMPKGPGAFGATAAPLVVGDLVVAGIGGGDAPLRGFLAAYQATTGEEVWRFYTIPKRGEPASETWKGKAIETGGGATWLTGSYDPATDTLYWPTGNPYPDTDGDERIGDNLYTNCVLALDPKTGKLKWHFQFTPHDLWDWDATEPLVLVDAKFQGRDRKLLLQANRNGFFYVLDRTTGEFLLGTPFVKRLTWATGVDTKGRPMLAPNSKPTIGGILTCPAVRGATNWYSTAYNPATKLFYVMAVEDCNIYRQSGSWFVPYSDPANPAVKLLRALDIETGKVVWEVPQVGAPESNYSGVLSTAGGLLFYGQSGGDFAAADAKTGKTLWHFNTGQVWKASPMTYLVKGKQHVAIAAGGNILAFTLD